MGHSPRQASQHPGYVRCTGRETGDNSPRRASRHQASGQREANATQKRETRVPEEYHSIQHRDKWQVGDKWEATVDRMKDKFFVNSALLASSLAVPVGISSESPKRQARRHAG